MDVDEVFILDSSFFLSNNQTHVDFDIEKIYFGGNYIYDNPDPIPDPRVSKGLPVWAIIVISLIGLVGVGVIIKYFLDKRKKDLSSGLADH